MSHTSFVIRDPSLGQTLVSYTAAQAASAESAEATPALLESVPSGASEAQTAAYDDLLRFLSGAQAASYEWFGAAASRVAAERAHQAAGAVPKAASPPPGAGTAESSARLNSSEWREAGEGVDDDADDEEGSSGGDSESASVEGEAEGSPSRKRQKTE